jgi:Helix-hairpin-helix motif
VVDEKSHPQPDPLAEAQAKDFLWTPSQRRGLIVILAIVLPILTIFYITHRRYIPDPQPAQGPRYADLADKIDPNTADQATLAAIPTLGDKRAATIIAYRDQYTAAHPGSIAFPTPESLMAVKGIGPAMTENLRPYLTFPTRPPQPAHAPTSRIQATPGSGSPR